MRYIKYAWICCWCYWCYFILLVAFSCPRTRSLYITHCNITAEFISIYPNRILFIVICKKCNYESVCDLFRWMCKQKIVCKIRETHTESDVDSLCDSHENALIRKKYCERKQATHTHCRTRKRQIQTESNQRKNKIQRTPENDREEFSQTHMVCTRQSMTICSIQ